MTPRAPGRRLLLLLALGLAPTRLRALPGPQDLRATDPAEALRLLALPGTAGLLRHASAPGVGDPPDFQLGRCDTQRNLDATGRDQARRIGARLRAAHLTPRVYTSEWCRTRETAELLGLGPVQPFRLLNSFFATPGAQDAQTASLRDFVQNAERPPVLLVTHQVNVTALTGLFPEDGELVLLRPGPDGPRIAARLVLTRP